MIVKCIKADYSESESEIVKNILTVGDEHLLPQLNQNYEVIGSGDFPKGKYYKLLEIDVSVYSCKDLLFPDWMFEVVSDEFVPNAWSERLNAPVREHTMYFDITGFGLKKNDDES